MSEPAIVVDGISKRYRIGVAAERYPTFREALVGAVKAPIRRWRRLREHGDGDDTIWALKDVSFEVQPGEVVGIIGRNGAGKSTLLKILSRITDPTEGYADLNGRVASLLEVGTGFHPELTGRENIYLNGAILGMKKAEIDRKFDEIVAFAEIEKFLDTPVKRYSSGMYVRLAFAVAAHLDPEILIVDEVLAVGDVQFQKKCLGKMQEVAAEGERTVLFVSHNMAAVQRLCTRGVVLNDGLVQHNGDASSAICQYLQQIASEAHSDLRNRNNRRGRGRVRLESVTVTAARQGAFGKLQTGAAARLSFAISDCLPGLTCTFTVYDHLGTPVANFSSARHSPRDIVSDVSLPGIHWETDELLLLPGRYRLNVALTTDGELEDHIEGAAVFDVEPGIVRGREASGGNQYGACTIPHRWIVPARRPTVDGRSRDASPLR